MASSSASRFIIFIIPGILAADGSDYSKLHDKFIVNPSEPSSQPTNFASLWLLQIGVWASKLISLTAVLNRKTPGL
jgi:hypothetical protein